MKIKITARPGPCSVGGPCYWHDWTVECEGGKASGTADSHRKAQRRARRAIRQLQRDLRRAEWKQTTAAEQ